VLTNSEDRLASDSGVDVVIRDSAYNQTTLRLLTSMYSGWIIAPQPGEDSVFIFLLSQGLMFQAILILLVFLNCVMMARKPLACRLIIIKFYFLLHF